MRILLAILLGLGVTAIAQADTLRMPPPASHGSATAVKAMPARGATMKQVESRFGAPLKRYPAAGGDTPKHPPITRWDYPGFSVYFERNRVLDNVTPGHPPPIRHRNQLQPATPG